MTSTGQPGRTDGEALPCVLETPLPEAAVAGIEALARSLGFRVFDVDLGGCHDKAGLLERAARAMGFPDWFGANWDAWFDCLTDLSWHPPGPGYVLLVRHTLRLRQAAPEALDTALAIVEDAARVWAGRGVILRAFVDAGT